MKLKMVHFKLFLCFLFVFVQSLFGAISYTETFNGNGWTKKSKENSNWSFRGASVSKEMYGYFESIFEKLQVPIPQTGSMVATNRASGGAFEGDFRQAGIKELGFNFLAKDVVPSSAIIRIFAGKRAYVQPLDISKMKPGKWVKYVFSLDSYDKWNGGDAYEQRFFKDLKNVTCVEVQVCRRGAKEQRYCIDNFYISNLKSEENQLNDNFIQEIENDDSQSNFFAREISFKNNFVEIVWDNLIPSRIYVVQEMFFNGKNFEWIDVDVFCAESIESIWRFEINNSKNIKIFRLRHDN